MPASIAFLGGREAPPRWPVYGRYEALQQLRQLAKAADGSQASSSRSAHTQVTHTVHAAPAGRLVAALAARRGPRSNYRSNSGDCATADVRGVKMAAHAV